MSARDLLRSNAATLVIGLIALAVGTLAGWSDAFARVVLAPPPILRLLLSGAAFLLGIAWLLQALARLSGAPAPPLLVRGVRYVFLAVAAFAATIGWLVGQAVPVVIALVVAGIDVLETTFLLIVLATRGPDQRA